MRSSIEKASTAHCFDYIEGPAIEYVSGESAFSFHRMIFIIYFCFYYYTCVAALDCGVVMLARQRDAKSRRDARRRRDSTTARRDEVVHTVCHRLPSASVCDRAHEDRATRCARIRRFASLGATLTRCGVPMTAIRDEHGDGPTSMDFARALAASEDVQAQGGEGWTELLDRDLEPLRRDDDASRERDDENFNRQPDDDNDIEGDGGGLTAQSVLRHSQDLGNAFKLAREDVGEQMLGALETLKAAESALKTLEQRQISSRDKANEELLCIKENVEMLQQKISESFV